MELPKRKQVRIREYDYSQNNVYFITVCTHKRAHLFGEIVEENLRGCPNNPHIIVEKWLIELENKYKNVMIDKYIIMPDHIHILLRQTGDHIGSPLPQIVDWFKTMTTNEYINGVKDGLYAPFDKHIWQRNYYEHIVRNQEDYYEIWEYIDGNPQKQESDYHL